MAYNKETAAQNVRHGMACVHVGQTTEGRRYGRVILYSTNPANSITGKTPDALHAKAMAHAQKYDRPIFVLRAVKPGTKEVLAWGQSLTFYNHEEKRLCTPQEIGDRMVEMAKLLHEQFPGTEFDMVPGISFPISQFSLKRDSDFEKMTKFASYYQDKEPDPETGSPIYLARMTAFAFSHDHGDNVNVIKLMDPSTPGIEPIYLSDVVPAHDLRTDMTTDNELAPIATEEAESDEDEGMSPSF